MERDPGIAGDYQRMWVRSRDALAAGTVNADPAPADGDTRWGVSLILQPTPDVTAVLLAEAAGLRTCLGPEHIYYDADNLHTTVRSLEAYRAHVPDDDAAIATYVELARQIGQRCLPFTIEYRGLTANTSSVLAQGWPRDDTLHRLRHSLHTSLVERSLVTSGPERERPRRTAHATLVLLQSAIERPGSLVSYIDASHDRLYGSSTVDALRIVRYRRTDIAVTTETLAVISAA